MFRHDLNRNFSWVAFFHWSLLSFSAGSVNAGGFLAFRRFVTHVTGFSTLFGIQASQGKWDTAIGIFTIPVFFLIGAAVSAVFVDRNIHKGHSPQYGAVMALACICLFAAAVGGYLGYFGAFGEELRLKRDYGFIALLCMSSGLQNAAVTTSSGSTVRTTHLTGITTDLGIGIVRVFTTRVKDRRRHRETAANWLRIGAILSFAAGSAIGALLFNRVGFLGFLLPAGISFYATLIAMRTEVAAFDLVKNRTQS